VGSSWVPIFEIVFCFQSLLGFFFLFLLSIHGSAPGPLLVARIDSLGYETRRSGPEWA
jgi:hypothetical protein